MADGRATSNRVPIFTAYLVWEVAHGQRYLHNVYAQKERALADVGKLDADGRTATVQEVPVFE